MHELFAPLAAGSVTHAAAFAPGQLAHSDLSLMLTFPFPRCCSFLAATEIFNVADARASCGGSMGGSAQTQALGPHVARRARSTCDACSRAGEEENIGREGESEALPIFGGLSEPSLSVLSDGSPAGVLTV